MTAGEPSYRIDSASEPDILCHLRRCSDNFTPPLEARLDLPAYAKKISELSVTFEAWLGGELVGMVAAYFNDRENLSGFITNVSVTRECMGKGIPSALMGACVAYARENRFRELGLEVAEENSAAIHLYRKFAFQVAGSRSGSLIMKLGGLDATRCEP